LALEDIAADHEHPALAGIQHRRRLRIGAGIVARDSEAARRKRFGRNPDSSTGRDGASEKCKCEPCGLHSVYLLVGGR